MIDSSLTRRGFLGTLAAGASAALVGCGGSSTGSTDPNELTTIVVWDRAGAHAKARQEFFHTWNEQKGRSLGIAVRYEPQATDKYEEIVRLSFQTKRAPDLFHSPSAQLGAFVAAGWVQPLPDLVDKAVLDKAAPYHQKNSELVWGGVPYAVPTTASTNRMLINTDLFEKAGLDPDSPPATFSEVRRAAAAITKSGDGDAFGMLIPIKATGFRQWSVDILLMAGDPAVAQFGLFNAATQKYESAKYAPLLELYRSMITDKTAYPGAATLTGDVANNAFGQGEAGMYVASSVVVSVLADLGSKVKVVAAPLPVPDGQKLVRSPMNAGYPYAISSTTENPEKAAAVFEVMVGDGVQEALAAKAAPPLSAAVWDSAAVKDNAFLQQFRPAELDQQWPKTPGGLLQVDGESVDQTVEKLLLDPSAPLEPALAAMQQRMQAAYDAAVQNGEVDPKEFQA
ncbi:extracellular solute-binding protein [Nonomuraea sp. K274]|uniref:Extracellular solute-binding protein n=1 Tax=Nonomuraea cypriaca TaxID=1187855 RepID=A0A931EVH9_9ACTN|nr:extracellular solute-binding protein [Nonomuraea cypriaca]MBF8184190.1 extracellular solute-binding protein [Nonomuraea cypriaca]